MLGNGTTIPSAHPLRDLPPMPDDSATIPRPHLGLDALAAEARAQLELLSYPRHAWVPENGEGVLDVAIIGAGQTGLVTAFGLLRERVQRVRIFDAAPAGGAGVWTTFARMKTLRTPKHVTGPDLGIPALTPRAPSSPPATAPPPGMR